MNIKTSTFILMLFVFSTPRYAKLHCSRLNEVAIRDNLIKLHDLNVDESYCDVIANMTNFDFM